LRPEVDLLPLENRAANTEGPRINFIEAVKRTLEVEMEANPRILVFGEDVGLKGGVHGATQDMQVQFGEKRVFDTSLIRRRDYRARGGYGPGRLAASAGNTVPKIC
jgi:2-oxoisovalerate dehydrogenase E1 component